MDGNHWRAERPLHLRDVVSQTPLTRTRIRTRARRVQVEPEIARRVAFSGTLWIRLSAACCKSLAPALRSLGFVLAVLGEADLIANVGLDFIAPTPAIEHAIVPNTRLHVMKVRVGWHAGAQIVGRFGLPDATDVVVLAFDGDDRGIADL